MAAQSAPVPALQTLLQAHVTEETNMLAVLFVDPGVAACSKTVDALAAVAPAGAALTVLLVAEEPTVAAVTTMGAAFPCPCTAIASDDALRRALGLSFVLALPELALVALPAWTVIATDGVAALRRGALAGDTFPGGWRTNSFTAQVADGSPCSSGVLLHPSDALHVGLYPGDTALLRNADVSRGASVCVFVNAPEDDHALCDGGGRATAASVPRGHLLLSAITAANLQAADGATLLLEPCLSPPPADSVTLQPLLQLGLPEGALQAPLAAFFGLPPPQGAPSPAADVTAGLQAALEAAGDTDGHGAVLAGLLAKGSDSWLVSYAASAGCLNRPVGAGEVLAVPLLGVAGALPGAVAQPPGATPRVVALCDAAVALSVAGSASEAATSAEGLSTATWRYAAEWASEPGAVTWLPMRVVATAPRGTVLVARDTALALPQAVHPSPQ